MGGGRLRRFDRRDGHRRSLSMAPLDSGALVLLVANSAAVAPDALFPYCAGHFLVRFLGTVSAHVWDHGYLSGLHLQHFLVGFDGSSFSFAGFGSETAHALRDFRFRGTNKPGGPNLNGNS